MPKQQGLLRDEGPLTGDVKGCFRLLPYIRFDIRGKRAKYGKTKRIDMVPKRRENTRPARNTA